MKLTRFSLPRLVVADGSLEALKWLGLVLMTGDHINKYLLNGTAPILFSAGRLAAPIFVFVLAFNLARSDSRVRGVYQRVIIRLAVFGALSTPAFIALGGLVAGWWPANILFTLLALTSTLFFLECGGGICITTAIAIFVFGGSLVEFWWPAILFGIAVWFYAKRPSYVAFASAALACSALSYINGNSWALVALPVIVAFTRFKICLPRCAWAFYAFYPAHLCLMWLVRIPLSNAGYLFLT